MDLVQILFGIIAFIGIAFGINYGYNEAVRTINDKAEAKYKNRPITFFKGLAVFGILFIFLLGFLLSEKDPSNLIAGAVISMLLLGALFARTANKTDAGFAALTVLFELIGAALFVVFIVAAILLFSGGGSKKNQKGEDVK